MVIADHLPGIFETWGGGYGFSYDESLEPSEVAFYFMGNDLVQLLMVDTSVPAGAEIFTADSERLGIERAGVPRLDLADGYLVGSVEIPGRFPGRIAEGLAARDSGDQATATVRLGRAVQIAHEAGNTETVRLLQKVVDVDDAATGTVRLKRDVEKTDEMALDVRSTRTVRVRKG